MLNRLNQLRLSLFAAAPAITRTTKPDLGIRSTMSSSSQTDIATFASGCFWGTEHIFLKHFPISQGKGIIKTSVGYTGGKDVASDPSYRDVCSGNTGHAEACRIEFDPAILKYEELVEFFYRSHDPTTANRQGMDTGTQYRSAIFTNSDEQTAIAQRVTSEIQQKYFDPKGKKIVTIIERAGPWYDAEDYHQEYLFKNPNGYQCPTHRLHW